jgi:hypothetical protein
MAQPFAGQTVECVGHSAANERIPDLAKACRSCVHDDELHGHPLRQVQHAHHIAIVEVNYSTTPPLMVTLSCSTRDKQ